ncbi:MAG TPA: hypothetical protein VKX46_15855, partial [Ktedonobacteraceae bacterium]|nr:hypothetical protein [Ktedonobacteraceae bacterium]
MPAPPDHHLSGRGPQAVLVIRAAIHSIALITTSAGEAPQVLMRQRPGRHQQFGMRHVVHSGTGGGSVLGNADHWMAVEVLQGQVDQVRLLIDADGVRMRGDIALGQLVH